MIRFGDITPAPADPANAVRPKWETGAKLDVVNRFDADQVWDNLPPPAKRMIGTAALNFLAAGLCQSEAQEVAPDEPLPLYRAGVEAERQAADMLADAFEFEVPWELKARPDGQPLIPALIGMVCERCGCSHEDACDEGCGWAADYLCTACAVGSAT